MSKDTVCLIAGEALNIGLKLGGQSFLRSSVSVSISNNVIGSVVVIFVVVVVVVVVQIALTQLGFDSRQVYSDRHSCPEVVGSFSDVESIKVVADCLYQRDLLML